MSERQPTPPTKLFELLKYCGIRQRDIVTRLGVSKALVSLWRSGHREIMQDDFIALLGMVNAVSEATCAAIRQRGAPTTPDAQREAAAYYAALTAKLNAAVYELSPEVVCARVTFAIQMFSDIRAREGEPTRWSDQTWGVVEAEAQEIITIAKLRRARIATSDQAAVFLSQLQEPPYATAHDRGECAGESDAGPGDVRTAATPQPDEEGLRAFARQAASRVRQGTAP